MKLTYRSTMLACYNGAVSQAVCVNLAPLLYLIFQRQYGFSLTEIGALIATNFFIQLSVDLLATAFSKHMNLRFCAAMSQFLIASGVIGLTVLPSVMPPFIGLLFAEILLGLGGGLTEVLMSPLIEACPTDEKSGSMSFMHSFYSWGQAGVVLLSSVYFAFLNPDTHWQYLPFLWSVVPIIAGLAFCVVPIYPLPEAEPDEKGSRSVFTTPIFWAFMVLMFCAGAAELVMSQWASGFAESALGVSKVVGDIAGPCSFAIAMGASRLLYGKYSHKISIETLIILGSLLCLTGYAMAAFIPHPVFAFVGCALCGFSVGVFWPGTLSHASATIRGGGVAMFALLAAGGDLGCLLGPSSAGAIADLFGGALRYAFCFAMLFPLLQLVLLIGMKKKKNGKGTQA